jgi:hypothetical protein
MRNLGELDNCRGTDAAVQDIFRGLFRGECSFCVARTGVGRDRVSPNLRRSYPNWYRELEHVKRLFFRGGETAMQLHVPPSEHARLAAATLHLWAPIDGREILGPPQCWNTRISCGHGVQVEMT